MLMGPGNLTSKTLHYGDAATSKIEVCSSTRAIPQTTELASKNLTRVEAFK
jgi:hypothetical protein